MRNYETKIILEKQNILKIGIEIIKKLYTQPLTVYSFESLNTDNNNTL